MKTDNLLLSELQKIVSNVYLDEPMKKHSSFKIGGNADVLIMPENIQQIQFILDICTRYHQKVTIIGNGTNLLISDNGIRGVVIKIADSFAKYKVGEDVIEAQAGICLTKLANVALRSCLSGAEFLSGIPGTLGGAIVMNAGAYGYEMKDIVEQTDYIKSDGQIVTINNEEHLFKYRSSIIQEVKGIVLKSRIKLMKVKNRETIRNLMDDLNTRRRQKQPISSPSAGSTFKRPQSYYTGELIDKCGLRGYKIGGAQVSELHSGFIINTGNATFNDVISLINHIQKAVQEKFGVKLDTEIKIVGD